jgi:hypothetical protein
MPWMWPDLLFKLLPEGREHDQCLNIIHQFTGKVIEERAQEFHANEIRGKRSAFLGKFVVFFSSSSLFIELRFTSQTNA